MSTAWTFLAFFAAFSGGAIIGFGAAAWMFAGSRADDETDELYFDQEGRDF